MRATGFDISVRVHNFTVSYNDIGPDGAPTIIFIHGFPFDKNMWNEQILFLSTKYRCIAYDLRGYGFSTNNSDQISIEHFADDLCGFMDVLQLSRAVVCGLSMGGYISLCAFNKYHNRFSGLILCDTQCYADSPETRETREKSIKQIQNKNKEEFISNFIKNAFSDKTFVKKNDLTKAAAKTISNIDDSVLVETLKALAEREDMCETLKNIDIPSLIICGESDKITPLKLSNYLRDHIRNSALEIIPQSGHLPSLEEPAIFNNLVEKFMAKHYLKFNETIIADQELNKTKTPALDRSI